MRTMFDSTTPGAIPMSAELVAGYIDGRYAWRPRDWQRWPAVRCSFITVNAANHGAIILDVERRVARPQQVAGWIRGVGPATGWTPTLYGTRSTLVQCHALVEAANLDCDYWLAEWNGIPHLPPGYALCQYASPAQHSGGHFDLSVAADWWPRPVGTPRPIH